MERRFRRQESASSSIGSGGLLRREMLGGSTNKSRHNSQVFTNNKEWQDYIAAVEGDHAELRQLYKAQTEELSSLRTLLAEQPIKDVLTYTLTSRVSEYETCLKELLMVLRNTEKLRERDDQNAHGGKKDQDSSKMRIKDCDSQLGVGPYTPATLMDAVRDAAMKHQQRMIDSYKTIEKKQTELKELERKLAAMKFECVHKVNLEEAYAVPASGVVCDCFVPSSAKELAELRARILDLEQQLDKSREDRRNIMIELKSAKHDAKVSSQSCKRSAEQLDGLRMLLDQKEKLLADMEIRYRAVEEEFEKQQHSGMNSPCPSPINGEVDAKSDSTKDKLVVTRHCHLLVGKEIVLAFLNALEKFADVFLNATSAALQLSRSRITILKTQLIGDRHGVSIEFDVQHSASLEEGAINSLIHRYSYHELQSLKERALLRQLEITEATARDAQEALFAKVQQAEALQKRVDGLQRLLGQRNREQESTERHVDVALDEAVTTVKSVYNELEVQRLETESANAALQKAREDASVQLQKVDNYAKKLEEAHKMMEATQSRLKTLERQLMTAEQQKTELEHSLRALRQGKNEQPREVASTATSESVVESFALRLPLSLSAASEADVAALFAGTSASGSPALEKCSVAVATLYRLLLCEASMATGTVPVRISRASMIPKKQSPTQSPTLDLKLELACFQAPGERESVCQSIAQKLCSCSFHYASRYLQEHVEVSRQLAGSVQGSVISNNAKTPEKTIQTSMSSSEKLLNTLEHQLDGALTTLDRQTAVGIQGKVDILIGRLRTLETALRQSKEVAKENEKRLIEEGKQALERLSAELQSSPQRCEELQRQLLEMETDMNDFAKIQASLQDSLEDTQAELRAKKQDHEYLKHYIRQIEKESERVKEENRRLRMNAIAAAAARESNGSDKRGSDSGGAKTDDSAETKSAIVVLQKTRSVLHDIMCAMQRGGGQDADGRGEPAAIADLAKAATDNYMLARQLHRAITALLPGRRSSPARRSDSPGDAAAAPARSTPAATAKEPKKSVLKPRSGSTAKGLARGPERAVRATPTAAFTRSATASGAHPHAPVRATPPPTPSSSGESASRGGSDGSGAGLDPRLTEAVVLTCEHRFASPVSRPPPVGLQRGGNPAGDAALSHWISSSSFHRSHTANNRLGGGRDHGDGGRRRDSSGASRGPYTRTLSGYRHV